MRFEHQWSEDETTFYKVVFTIEELQAAAAATGLDMTAFRGMHVFHHHHDFDHRVDGDRMDPKAVAHMQPLVEEALNRRDEAHRRSSAWRTAKRLGWQVLDENGAPVPEPATVGQDW